MVMPHLRKEQLMDKNSVKDAVMQVAQAEIEQLVETLADRCGELIDNRDPKEFEGQFAFEIKSFGARLLGRALEAMEPAVVVEIRKGGHALRDPEEGALPCACTGVLDLKGHKEITWDTTLGKVQLWRQTGQCRACGRWLGLLDEFLEVTPQRITLGLASAVALAGTCEAYAPASAILQECLHQTFDDNRIRATVLEVAKRAEGWVTLSGPELEETAKSLPTTKPLTVYVGVDGGRVQIVNEGWKEPCEGVIWWTDPGSGRRERIAVGDVTNKEAVLGALDRWIQCARKRNPKLTLVIIADGAPWIWKWARKYRKAIKILDYYHLKERVWKAADGVYERDREMAQGWVDAIMDGLWAGGVREVIETLEHMREFCVFPAADPKDKAMLSLIEFLDDREDLIDYARHRAADRTIGSGIVESTCKQLFNMRLKGPGMRWSRAGAQAIIHLRCLHITGRWANLWRRRPREAISA